jgi:hypothetical protein
VKIIPLIPPLEKGDKGGFDRRFSDETGISETEESGAGVAEFAGQEI